MPAGRSGATDVLRRGRALILRWCATAAAAGRGKARETADARRSEGMAQMERSRGRGVSVEPVSVEPRSACLIGVHLRFHFACLSKRQHTAEAPSRRAGQMVRATQGACARTRQRPRRWTDRRRGSDHARVDCGRRRRPRRSLRPRPRGSVSGRGRQKASGGAKHCTKPL
jgi:hypothetical protein